MTYGHRPLSVVAFSKCWGLFYLIALSIGVVAYASGRPTERFDARRSSILDEDDRPWTIG